MSYNYKYYGAWTKPMAKYTPPDLGQRILVWSTWTKKLKWKGKFLFLALPTQTCYLQRSGSLWDVSIPYQSSKYVHFFLQIFIFKTISKLTSSQTRWAGAKLLKFKGIKHKYLLTSYTSALWGPIFHWSCIYFHNRHFLPNNEASKHYNAYTFPQKIFSYNKRLKPSNLKIEFFPTFQSFSLNRCKNLARNITRVISAKLFNEHPCNLCQIKMKNTVQCQLLWLMHS